MRQRICVQLLDNLNNWSFTLWKLSRCSNLDPCSYLKDATSDEVSEHSLDLDRSMEYFGERELISEEQAKLDRIMTALSFKLEYFQGIMPMGAALLSRFD